LKLQSAFAYPARAFHKIVLIEAENFKVFWNPVETCVPYSPSLRTNVQKAGTGNVNYLIAWRTGGADLQDRHRQDTVCAP
jgi:hypothetical protein